MRKKENRTINRSLVVVLLVAMFAMLLVGCKKPAEEPPVPSTSEVISEVVSEEPSEEVSEVVSEEPSEEVSEEAAPEVEIVDFSNINELLEYAKERNQATIAEFDFSVAGSSQAIIPNGSNYTMQMGERLHIIAVKEVESIDANVDGIGMMESVIQDVWTIGVYNSGTDMEVSFTVNYTDGTSEDFTIYVTKE